MITYKDKPSETGKVILNALQSAVATALERKRRLGQYVVIWDGQKPVLKGEDAPQEDRRTS